MVSVLLIAAQVGSMWFHSAGVYQGDANVPLREFPEDLDIFFVLTFAPRSSVSNTLPTTQP